jgi:HSP20 family molecular chaperone IbpA
MSTFEHLDLLVRNFFDSSAEFRSAFDSKIQYPVDIYETATGIVFEIAAVGADREDITISTQGDQLRVTYNKSTERESTRYLNRNIAKRNFDLGWRLSAKFDLNKISAKLDKGLLVLEIPYISKATPKTIEIQ